MRRDLALGLPFVPLYSAAELVLVFAVGGLVQLIFIDTPRVAVSSLVPEGLRGFVRFGQTLDRKDLAFAVPQETGINVLLPEPRVESIEASETFL